ncbi:hypothetical protein TNCV_31311 [Trichonephila clavipes]|nr:hypothetical protein TNCV_31311 [Trichonephila clavipes]
MLEGLRRLLFDLRYPQHYRHVVVVVSNATSLTLSDRGPRNSSWQGAKSTPVVGLEHHTGDSTNELGEILRRDDRWNHLFPPPQFIHRTEGNILQPPAPVIQRTRHRTH